MHDMIESLCVWRHLRSTRHQKREGKLPKEESWEMADVISTCACVILKSGRVTVIRPGRYIKRASTGELYVERPRGLT